MNQFELAIRVIEKLNEKGKVTTQDLLNDPDIPIQERQIQRTLNELSSMPWIQVEIEGRKKVFSLLENYKLKDSFFSESELTFVSALIEFSKKALKKDKSEFLDKLKNKVLHANSFSQVYYMFDPDSIDIEKVSENRGKLEECIKGEKLIEIHYSKYNRNYELKPYKILFHEGFWYLIAEHENVIKKFCLDFIDHIEIIRSSSFNKEKVDKLLENSRNLWFYDSEKTKVKVEIKKDFAHYFQRKVLLPNQKIEETLKNGNIVIEFEVYNRGDLASLIFKWIPNIKILSPEKYKKFLAKELEEMVNFNR